MNPKSKILFTLMLVPAVGSVVMAEDDIPIRYTRPMRNTVSVGLRVLAGGANVNFSHLGGIAYSYAPYTRLGQASDANEEMYKKYPGLYTSEKVTTGDTTTTVYKFGVNYYDNGTVYLDARRTSKAYSEYYYDNGWNGVGVTTTLVAVTDGRYKTVTKTLYTNSGAGTDVGGNYVPYYDPVTGYKMVDVTSAATYLAYQEGVTRNWNITSTDGDQFVTYDSSSSSAPTVNNTNPTGVRMDRFYTESVEGGGSYSASSGTAPGFEIELDHIIRKESLRFEWGYKVGLGFSSISAKKSGTVYAQLKNDYTVYKLASAFNLDTSTYTGGLHTDEDGNEDTIPLALYNSQNGDVSYNGTEAIANPDYVKPSNYDSMSESEKALEALKSSYVPVTGHWQIKGAYYMMSLGPSARYYFSPRLSVSASGGPAVAFFGTQYVVDESYAVAYHGVTKTLSYYSGNNQVAQRKSGFSPGFYANVNAEVWLTPSTGFYAGVAYEKFGKYSQEVDGHKAAIDIGKGMVFKFGINTRF